MAIRCYSCMEMVKDESLRTCPYCFNPLSYEAKENTDLPAGISIHRRYLIGRALGRGGNGVTYIALDTHTNKRCAIKECFPKNACTRSFKSPVVNLFSPALAPQMQRALDNFRAEKELLEVLNNSGFAVDYVDYFHENGTSYLVMEYANLTLSRHIDLNNGRLAPDKAARLMESLMITMQQLHGFPYPYNGGTSMLLHRDISTDNICLYEIGKNKRRPEYQVRLIDFGSAEPVARQQNGEKLKISKKSGYTSPEQYRSEYQDQRSDLYSAGVVFYKMLCGHPPLEADDTRITHPLNVRGEAAGTPEWMAKIIEKATQPDPAKRFQSAKEFLDALHKGNSHPSAGKLGLMIGVPVGVILVAGVLVFSSGGQKSQPVAPKNTAEETASPSPTSTPAPTFTPVPTALPTAESTAAPTEAPATEVPAPQGGISLSVQELTLQVGETGTIAIVTGGAPLPETEIELPQAEGLVITRNGAILSVSAVGEADTTLTFRIGENAYPVRVRAAGNRLTDVSAPVTSLRLGQTAQMTLTMSQGPAAGSYRASVTGESVALEDAGGGLLNITAVQVGSSVVVVEDGYGTRQEIPVTVESAVIGFSEASLVLSVGEESSIHILTEEGMETPLFTGVRNAGDTLEITQNGSEIVIRALEALDTDVYFMFDGGQEYAVHIQAAPIALVAENCTADAQSLYNGQQTRIHVAMTRPFDADDWTYECTGSITAVSQERDVLLVTANAPGEGSVAVVDRYGNRKEIPITVEPVVTGVEPASLSLQVGVPQTVQVKTAAGLPAPAYTGLTNGEGITVEQEGSLLRITASAETAGTLGIEFEGTVYELQVNAEGTHLSTLTAEKNVLFLHDTIQVTVGMTNGFTGADYTVEAGGSIALESQTDNTLVIRADAIGPGTLTVTDRYGGVQTMEINVAPRVTGLAQAGVQLVCGQETAVDVLLADGAALPEMEIVQKPDGLEAVLADGRLVLRTDSYVEGDVTLRFEGVDYALTVGTYNTVSGLSFDPGAAGTVTASETNAYQVAAEGGRAGGLSVGVATLSGDMNGVTVSGNYDGIQEVAGGYLLSWSAGMSAQGELTVTDALGNTWTAGVTFFNHVTSDMPDSLAVRMSEDAHLLPLSTMTGTLESIAGEVIAGAENVSIAPAADNSGFLLTPLAPGAATVRIDGREIAVNVQTELAAVTPRDGASLTDVELGREVVLDVSYVKGAGSLAPEDVWFAQGGVFSVVQVSDNQIVLLAENKGSDTLYVRAGAGETELQMSAISLRLLTNIQAGPAMQMEGVAYVQAGQEVRISVAYQNQSDVLMPEDVALNSDLFTLTAVSDNTAVLQAVRPAVSGETAVATVKDDYGNVLSVTLSAFDPNAENDAIALLQQTLIDAGYSNKFRINGVFNQNTRDALHHYLQDRGMEPNDWLTADQWEMLKNDAVAEQQRLQAEQQTNGRPVFTGQAQLAGGENTLAVAADGTTYILGQDGWLFAFDAGGAMTAAVRPENGQKGFTALYGGDGNVTAIDEEKYAYVFGGGNRLDDIYSASSQTAPWASIVNIPNGITSAAVGEGVFVGILADEAVFDELVVPAGGAVLWRSGAAMPYVALCRNMGSQQNPYQNIRKTAAFGSTVAFCIDDDNLYFIGGASPLTQAVAESVGIDRVQSFHISVSGGDIHQIAMSESKIALVLENGSVLLGGDTLDGLLGPGVRLTNRTADSGVSGVIQAVLINQTAYYLTNDGRLLIQTGGAVTEMQGIRSIGGNGACLCALTQANELIRIQDGAVQTIQLQTAVN